MHLISADCATDRQEDFAVPYPVVIRTESGVHTPTPSEQTYIPLLEAFNFFNRELFNATLPDVLVTLQRKARTLGYFSRDRFAELKGDARAHEIAMNPAHFRQRSPKDTCSTLVHEMAHLQQECFGKPTRAGYHNREWARMMREIGLHPSSTGAPGGKETGYRMDHYIVEGGPFDLSYARFETVGQTIGWGDAIAATPAGGGEGAGEGVVEGPKPKRLKFVCTGCGQNVYGSPKTAVRCDRCDLLLIVTQNHHRSEAISL
jgi:ribosomal protein S27E